MLHEFRHRNLLTLFGVVALAMSIGACTPATTLEQGWTAPRQHQAPLSKVVTLYDSESVSIRRAGEDKLARDLAAHGVVATPGYAVLSDTEAHALANMTPQQLGQLEGVTSRLRNMGYDGIVTMKLVDREQDLHYAPSSYSGWGYPGYWGYWDYPGWSSSGYAYTETTYRTETTAYSLRTNQLVWTGLIKTVDPSDARQLINQTSGVVAGQLAKRGLAG